MRFEFLKRIIHIFTHSHTHTSKRYIHEYTHSNLTKSKCKISDSKRLHFKRKTFDIYPYARGERSLRFHLPCFET